MSPEPASAPASSPEADTAAQAAATGFVLELARALHESGTPSHRLEAALQTVASRLGLRAAFFSTPTSIMVGFGDLIDQRVHLLRVEPAETNLGNLAQLSDIVRDVIVANVTPQEGLRRIQALKEQPKRWPL